MKDMKLRIEVGSSHKTVTVQIDEIAKGVADIIAENEEWRTLVAFGMLPNGLIENLDKQVKDRIIKDFAWLYEVEKDKIDRFAKEATSAISRRIYSHSKMLV